MKVHIPPDMEKEATIKAIAYGVALILFIILMILRTIGLIN